MGLTFRRCLSVRVCGGVFIFFGIPMNALLSTNQPLTMSSREIADLVQSRHDNVKTTIERLAAKGVIEFPATQGIPTATRPVKVYLIGKRDSYVIVAQLSPEFTARLVDRWQELEEGQRRSPVDLLSDPSALRRAYDTLQTQGVAVAEFHQCN